MKVKDLIKQLQRCDQDAVVFTREYNGCDHMCYPVVGLVNVNKGDTPCILGEGLPNCSTRRMVKLRKIL